MVSDLVPAPKTRKAVALGAKTFKEIKNDAISSKIVTFEPSLFAPEHLLDARRLQIALGHLKNAIASRNECPTVAVHVMIEGLVDQPFVFEYICSVSVHVRNFVANHIVAALPKETKAYFGSKWQILFERNFTLIHNHPRIKIEDEVLVFYQARECSALLKVLLEMDGEALDLRTFEHVEALFNDSLDDEFDGTPIIKKKGQGSMKKAKRIATKIQAIERLLSQAEEIVKKNQFDIVLPTTGEELKASVKNLTCLLHAGLECLIHLFANEEIKASCIAGLTAICEAKGVHFKDGIRETDPGCPQTGQDASLQSPTTGSLLPARELADGALLGAGGETPIRCHLLVRNAKRLGPWQIFLSGAAVQHWRQHGKTGSLDMITKKIKELSDGFFSDSNMKPLTGSREYEFPIYEAKLSKNLRIIYQVDMFPDAGQNSEVRTEVQGITIWGIHNHNEIRRRTLELIARKLHAKGKEYCNRCKYRWQPKAGGYYHPVSFPQPEAEVVAEDEKYLEMTREEALELHNLLVLQKKYPLSEHLYKTIRDDRNASHIFGPSGDEIRIIQHPSSCYVIGRSGTGKTTAMLYKILAVEATYLNNPDMFFHRPKQLFVTQSRVLAARVKEYYDSLALTLGEAKKAADTVSESASEKTQGDAVLLKGVDEDDLPHRLPKSFDELEEGHFPLFLSFDQLCKLFENQFKLNFGRGITSLPTADGKEHLFSTTPKQEDAESFSNTSVNYRMFLEGYWKHFPETLTKRLHPFLVYCEIIGIIKGSEEALGSESGILDEEDYINLSARSKSTFADQRQLVYQIFTHYQNKKREYCDFDSADRSRVILQNIKKTLRHCNQVDYLYVDEVQDQSILEIQLLRSLCRNPQGLCWAGDTAQTIAAGSTFRFNDLKASLYRLENARTDKKLMSKGEPPVFHLRKNYRSHGGIVDCAASVVDIITHFWPESIDQLEREEGVIAATNLKPIFFKYHEDSEPPYMHFISGESKIEFGAQQCILVRDPTSRDRLRRNVGDIGVILTIYECKGLEFSDVLLYDFFGDSSVSAAEWRLVLNMVTPDERGGEAAPKFSSNSNKYRAVGNELKNLYVAITRARSQVWIMDISERGEPMRSYWTAKDKIVNWDSGLELPPMAVSSTPMEWRERGTVFYDNRNYHAALYSFERSGDEALATICRAYILLQKAEELSRTPSERTKSQTLKSFIQAAEAFDALPSRQRWKRIAAECYGKGGSHLKAAERYYVVELHEKCIFHYWEAKAMDEAAKVFCEHRNYLSTDFSETYERRLRTHYVRLGDFQRAALLFESDDEQLEFMEERVLDQQMAKFLIYKKRYEEAADIYLSENDKLRAIETLLHPECVEGTKRGLELLVKELWDLFPLHCEKEWPVLGDELVKLMNTACDLDFDSSEGRELQTLRLIHHPSKALAKPMERFIELIQKAEGFSNQQLDALSLKLMDSILELTIPANEFTDMNLLATNLNIYENYERALRHLINQGDLVQNNQAQKLFGFRLHILNEPILDNEEVTLLPGSPLYEGASRWIPSAIATSERRIGERELRFHLGQFVKSRLQHLALEEEERMRDVRILRVCYGFALTGACRRVGCPNQHYRSEELSKDFYLSLLRVLLSQFNLMLKIPGNSRFRSDKLKMQSRWFTLLHDTLRPPIGRMGSQVLSALPSQILPQLQQSSLKQWLKEALYVITPTVPTPTGFAMPKLLIYDLTLATHLAFTLYPQEVGQYMRKIPSYLLDRVTPDLMRNPNNYIVHDLFAFLEGTQQSYLYQGFLFLKHVVENRMVIDINILTCLAEQLCAKLLMQEKKLYQGDYHNLHIPKSWALQYFEKVPSYASRFGDKQPLIRVLGNLMSCLHQGQVDHLLLQGTPGPLTNRQITATFIHRLCRCVSLLAFNSRRQSDIREFVEWELKKISGSDPRSPYHRFTKPTNKWADITIAIRSSFAEDEGEELIAFSLASKSTIPDTRGVRIVNYKDNKDLTILIQFGLPEKRPTFLSGINESKELGALLKDRAERIVQEVDKKNNQVVGMENASEEYLSDQASEPSDDVPEEIVIETPSLATTQKETDAAVLIQLTYRRYAQDRPHRDQRRRRAKENAVFYRCHTTFSFQNILPDNYRRVCLWRLPALLDLVSKLPPLLMVLKKDKNNQWLSGENTDAADESLMKIRRVVEVHKEVKKALELTSPGLMKGELSYIEKQADSLRDILDEVDSLLDRDHVKKLRKLLDDGTRRLESYRNPTSSKERPSLNTADMYGIEDSCY